LEGVGICSDSQQYAFGVVVIFAQDAKQQVIGVDEAAAMAIVAASTL
jgi:hypothetical protein